MDFRELLVGGRYLFLLGDELFVEVELFVGGGEGGGGGGGEGGGGRRF